MNPRDLMHFGIDVDDKRFHCFSFSISTGEAIEFSCLPKVSSLLKELQKRKLYKDNLKMCYEASYLGFSLCRSLQKAGYHCDVIAPSLIPKTKGDKVKTDRLDAEKLARYYASGLLSIVHVPNVTQEMDRDLLRSRRFIVEQMAATKKHINSMTRRLGWHYKEESGGEKNWTKSYVFWLKQKIKANSDGSLKTNFETLLRHYESCLERVFEYDNEVETLSVSTEYKDKVQALTSYRGINQQTALVLVTELGDIQRFTHPKQLTSYAGLDIIERSSGGHERKFGISKDGNKFIRTAVVESCQTASRPVMVSRHVNKRRVGVEALLIDIADRCMVRLNKKSRILLARGKTRNKVKVACAREMLSFIWESLRAVQALS